MTGTLEQITPSKKSHHRSDTSKPGSSQSVIVKQTGQPRPHPGPLPFKEKKSHIIHCSLSDYFTVLFL